MKQSLLNSKFKSKVLILLVLNMFLISAYTSKESKFLSRNTLKNTKSSTDSEETKSNLSSKLNNKSTLENTSNSPLLLSATMGNHKIPEILNRKNDILNKLNSISSDLIEKYHSPSITDKNKKVVNETKDKSKKA